MASASFFTGNCPTCGPKSRFVELKVEACLQPDEGPKKAWHGFKCLGCKKRERSVEAPEGLHLFEDGEHVVETW